MPLQNRVDPLGQLHATPARGAWFGNRGCLHDAAGVIRRHHQGMRWICCLTEFPPRKRPLLVPGRYTELFFLDEATAYAAGHRPCAECRRPAFKAFEALWDKQFGETGAAAIDQRLQAARWHEGGRRLMPVTARDVPPGAMVQRGEAVLLRGFERWWRWSFEGYAAVADPGAGLQLITPEPIAALMWRGLEVQRHRSAE